MYLLCFAGSPEMRPLISWHQLASDTLLHYPYLPPSVTCHLVPAVGIVSSVNETAWINCSSCIRPWRSLSSTCKSECLQEQSDLSPSPNQEANARCSGAPSVLLDRAGAHLFLGLVCTGQKSFLTVVDLLKCLCSLKRDFILLWEVSII